MRGNLDCHPEQAFFARRRIRASRAKCRGFCDTIIARLARFFVASLSILALCGALSSQTPQDLLSAGGVDQAIQTLEQQLLTAPTAETHNFRYEFGEFANRLILTSANIDQWRARFACNQRIKRLLVEFH